jgi:hypothetical protein
MVLHLLCFTVVKVTLIFCLGVRRTQPAKLCGFFSAAKVPGVLFALYLIWTTD